MTAYRQPCGHTAARIITTRNGDLYECRTCGVVTVAETPETIARRNAATLAYKVAYNAVLADRAAEPCGAMVDASARTPTACTRPAGHPNAHRHDPEPVR